MKKNYRVYKIEKNKKERSALGIWQGIKDSIAFSYYDDIDKAKIEAQKILDNTKEACIAIESIEVRELYLVTREGIEVLRHYKELWVKDKKAFRTFKKLYPNYTLELRGAQIIAFAYDNIIKAKKEIWQITKKEYIDQAVKNAIGRQVVLNKGIAKSAHSLIVKQALKEGKSIPLEVLKDYPDLIVKKQAGFISLQAIYAILIIGALVFCLIIGNGILNAGKQVTNRHNQDIYEVLK